MRKVLALVLALAAAPLGARESLRLPWAFSDEPDLCADFGFMPGHKGNTVVEMSLGGRFAHFGLPKDAKRAPRLAINCEFSAPSELERSARSMKAVVDLAQVLEEYGLKFDRGQFGSSSRLVYKTDLSTELAPGDYNVRITIKDEELQIESRRTLHLIVPDLETKTWQLSDLKFITAVGKRLDDKGKEHRVLDPNPWRQVGADLGWDLMLAYSDLGPRPPGALTRTHRVRQLRGDEAVMWEETGPAPKKKGEQVWLIRVPEKTASDWKGGVYVMEVELKSGDRVAKASKTFEVLP